MPNQQMLEKEEVILHKLSIYMFLQKFYVGEMNTLNTISWKELISLLQEEVAYFSNETMTKGFQFLSQLTEKDAMELEFVFNRLFVGPNQLEASPYESTYRNQERAIMQRETLAVRDFYSRAGLVVTRKNIEPDDHIALELEFVCYLLENSLEEEKDKKLYEEFLREHLFQWVDSHTELVRNKTKNNILLGVSYLLQGILFHEKSNFKGGLS